MSDTTSPPPRFAWDWALAWVGVFAFNLPIPLLFGVCVVGEGGLFGLVGALAVIFWFGFALCLFRFRVGRSLVAGGGVVAVTQFLPLLHLICGMFGMYMWEAIGGTPLPAFDSDEAVPTDTGWQHDPNLAAFLIVFFTTHPLIVAALVLGAGVRAMYGDRPIWANTPADPDAS